MLQVLGIIQNYRGLDRRESFTGMILQSFQGYYAELIQRILNK
jgi:hypothetical protein